MKKRTEIKFVKAILYMAITVVVMISGCTKDIKNDIKDLQQRVTTLENADNLLRQQFNAGVLVSSVTPLANNAGWKIEFTGGSMPSIEIRNGADAITPKIEVRFNADGSVTLWYNVTKDYPASGWVDTGVNLRGPQGSSGANGAAGPQGPTGPAGSNGNNGTNGTDGADGISPKIEMRDNADGTFTIWYNVTDGYPAGGWVSTGVDLPIPDGFFLAVTDNLDGTVTFTMNDGVPTEYTFEKASTAVRFEIVNSSVKVEIAEDGYGSITFRVNPSNAWIPTGSGAAIDKWALDQTGVTRSYVTNPDDFELLSILPDPDPDKQGQYIATIYCSGTTDPSVNDYLMALVLNINSVADPILISSSTFILGTKTATSHTPLTWATVQSVVDGMNEGDILDMSELPMIPDYPVPNSTAVITISKSITVTALLDPLGFTSGTLKNTFQNVAFVLSGNPTVTFDRIGSYRVSAGAAQSLISGTGNVIIRESNFYGNAAGMLTPSPTIDIDGDFWMYGTIAENIDNNIIHTTSVAGMSVDAPGSTKAGTAIRARNVTIEGGFIDGGYSYVSGAPAGNGIEASGNVMIKGHNILGLISGDPLMPCETTLVYGGSASDGDGGHAIVAAGTVTINGGGATGGNGSGTNSKGGDGLIAGGNVYLEGERYDYYSDGGMWFTCYIRSGVGDYITGVPFRFSGSSASPARTLTANTAMICGVNAVLYAAPYCMELQQNDRAIFDDCRIGWYTTIPLFSGGWYKITNPFATWGTFDNATELP